MGSQEIPGITSKFGLGIQNEAGQRLTVLPREHTGQRKTSSSNNTREDSTCGHHWMVNTERWGSFIQSAKARLGADCGSYHELLIANFRLKFKKVGKNH